MHQSGLSAVSGWLFGTDGLGARRFLISVVVDGGVGQLVGPPRQHVDDGILDERGEDEHEADDHPDVNRLDVGHSRQRGPRAAAHRRRRQHGQQAERDARRTRVDVDPERHPRQDHDQDRRNVDLDEEIADVAAQHEDNLEARKLTWAKRRQTTRKSRNWSLLLSISVSK